MRIDIKTRVREELIDVTRLVADAVAGSSVSDGAALVYCPHTTAGVTVNEHADPDVAADIVAWLSEVCARDSRWRHVEGNADAHVKATLVGSSALVPVRGGRLDLGTWQGVFFCEFDGPRSRHFDVRMLVSADR